MSDQVDEALDHELHRLACTRSMKLAVEAKAKAMMITQAHVMRIALAEYLGIKAKN